MVPAVVVFLQLCVLICSVVSKDLLSLSTFPHGLFRGKENAMFVRDGEGIDVSCSAPHYGQRLRINKDGELFCAAYEDRANNKCNYNEGTQTLRMRVLATRHTAGQFVCSAGEDFESAGFYVNFYDRRGGAVKIDIYVNHSKTSSSNDPVVNLATLKPRKLRLDCLPNSNYELAEGSKAVWRVDNKTVVSDHHTHLHDNGSLVVSYPSAYDTGIYSCEMDLRYRSVAVSHLYNAWAVVKGLPAVDIRGQERSVNMNQGQTAEVTCNVVGYPRPQVHWLRDGKHITNVTGMSFTGDNSTLRIHDLQYDDRAEYTCVVENDMGKANHTMLLRVRDPLGPLWPFIGIVLELSILAVIIVWYERRKRAKKAAEAGNNNRSPAGTPEGDSTRRLVDADIRKRSKE